MQFRSFHGRALKTEKTIAFALSLSSYIVLVVRECLYSVFEYLCLRDRESVGARDKERERITESHNCPISFIHAEFI